MDKKVVVLTDVEDLDILAIFIVKEGDDPNEVRNEIKKIKEENPDWETDDIVKKLSDRYEIIKFDNIYHV